MYRWNTAIAAMQAKAIQRFAKKSIPKKKKKSRKHKKPSVAKIVCAQALDMNAKFDRYAKSKRCEIRSKLKQEICVQHALPKLPEKVFNEAKQAKQEPILKVELSGYDNDQQVISTKKC